MLRKEQSVFFFVFFLFFVLDVHSQFIPPAKFDGFVYKNGPINSDTIVIDAFLDPVCPYSRDSWPALKYAVESYGPSVRLMVHLFPLPYRDNAFVASRALHIVNMLNTSATFHLLEGFFKHQEKFYYNSTRNMSRDFVVNHIVKFATEVTGNSYHGALYSGFKDIKTDLKTRVSFKAEELTRRLNQSAIEYGASRGVYGTPSFFINGFFLPDAGSTTNFTGWRNFIDPLIGERGQQE